MRIPDTNIKALISKQNTSFKLTDFALHQSAKYNKTVTISPATSSTKLKVGDIVIAYLSDSQTYVIRRIHTIQPGVYILTNDYGHSVISNQILGIVTN